jgi:hypothetical protein
MGISFIPSQKSTNTNFSSLSYTANPRKLLFADLRLCFGKWKFVPGIFFPWRLGKDADPYDELYPSLVNLKSILIHIVMFISQVLFLMSIPFFFLAPTLWMVWGLFFWGFHTICYLLMNGRTIRLEPSKHIVPIGNHDDEYWIFLNGVAVGKDWAQSNIDRLSLSFGRTVHGVLNPTDGVLFDMIECLVQRNMSYATNDIRSVYVSIKAALYSEKIKKVVFVMHSQGCIEGGLIIDWLLDEGKKTYQYHHMFYLFYLISI